MLPADNNFDIYSQQLSDAHSHMLSILLHSISHMDTPSDYSNFVFQNGIVFPFLIPVLMCLSSFSGWPTPVITVSHHNIVLSFSAAAHQYSTPKLNRDSSQ